MQQQTEALHVPSENRDELGPTAVVFPSPFENPSDYSSGVRQSPGSGSLVPPVPPAAAWAEGVSGDPAFLK